VGNKCDLEHKRQVSLEQGKGFGKYLLNLADEHGIKFLETSAKETVNIEELFISTTKTFMTKQSLAPLNQNRRTIGSSINLNNTDNRPQSSEGGCC
jgi:Ras-related protein Rab-8A